MKTYVPNVKVTVSNLVLNINKEDVYDMLDFLYENKESTVTITYNTKLETLLLETNRVTLVKIISNNNVNILDGIEKCYNVIELYGILDKQLELIREGQLVC